MNAHRITPADVVGHLFEPDELARVLGQHPKTRFNWRRSSIHRDAGDIPSARHMRKLLAAAEAAGIPLRAEHLVFGATPSQVEALVAARELAEAAAREAPAAPREAAA